MTFHTSLLSISLLRGEWEIGGDPWWDRVGSQWAIPWLIQWSAGWRKTKAIELFPLCSSSVTPKFSRYLFEVDYHCPLRQIRSLLSPHFFCSRTHWKACVLIIVIFLPPPLLLGYLIIDSINIYCVQHVESGPSWNKECSGHGVSRWITHTLYALFLAAIPGICSLPTFPES